MRKLGVFIIGATFAVGGTFLAPESVHASADSGKERVVYVGGMSAGFTLKTGGAQVIGICEVATEQGVSSPAMQAGLRAGDLICKIGGVSIESIGELNEIIHKSQGKCLQIEIVRGEERIKKEITPVKDKANERYKIGVLVRDSVSGIGTVTYIDKDSGRFGSLGHAVTSAQNQQMEMYNGEVYSCSIVSVNKGARGKAGELRGMFLSDKPFGNAEKLCNCGIFGQINEDYDTTELMSALATSEDVQPGSAYIYSTVNGVCPKKYAIEIVKVDKHNKENKNYVIKIKDEDLIEETGGIVQGMSGSPIIQKGKLVGAVTHVFLNDPTRGYGIDIQTMLSE